MSNEHTANVDTRLCTISFFVYPPKYETDRYRESIDGEGHISIQVVKRTRDGDSRDIISKYSCDRAITVLEYVEIVSGILPVGDYTPNGVRMYGGIERTRQDCGETLVLVSSCRIEE